MLVYIHTHNSTYYDAERFEIWNTGTKALNLIFAEKKKNQGCENFGRYSDQSFVLGSTVKHTQIW